MGEMTGPRHFARNKLLPRAHVEHPCQSCSDEAQPWRLQLLDNHARPDRDLWLCHACAKRYLEIATRDHGRVHLTFVGHC